MGWLGDIDEWPGERLPVVRVMVIGAEGSVPRDAGTVMIISAQTCSGTIGGGALEHQAIGLARRMILEASPQARWLRQTASLPLGPSLGQCCGGHVRLLLELVRADEQTTLADRAGPARLLARPLASGGPVIALDDRKDCRDLPLGVQRVAREMLSGAQPAVLQVMKGRGAEPDWLLEPIERDRPVLHLYGAGHVGRAIMRVTDGLVLRRVWIDTAPERFPDDLPSQIETIVAADPAAHAGIAPADGCHIVLTYSHALDLAICHALLARGDFAFLGLIGSATKRARFLKRLGEAGHGEAALARLVCPIGIEGITDKEPAAIAIATAAQLLRVIERTRAAEPAGACKGMTA